MYGIFINGEDQPRIISTDLGYLARLGPIWLIRRDVNEYSVAKVTF